VTLKGQGHDPNICLVPIISKMASDRDLVTISDGQIPNQISHAKSQISKHKILHV